jgi:phosphoglycolate phosphatase-like HAD superfamily hydrolase
LCWAEILRQHKAIFWDFDGVIKESVEVKGRAFYQMFLPYGGVVALRVCEHHIANGGMSRMDKMPLYLKWAGETGSVSNIDAFCLRYGEMVLQAVVEAPWVPGVESLLRTNPYRQSQLVVSATPQGELEEIIRKLDLTQCFSRVYGAPIRKKDAIQMVLAEQGLEPSDCLMIGDALADLEAAEANAVPFLLRRHTTNAELFSSYAGPSVEDFAEP